MAGDRVGRSKTDQTPLASVARLPAKVSCVTFTVPAIQRPLAQSMLAAVTASGRLLVAFAVIDAPASGIVVTSGQIAAINKAKMMRRAGRSPLLVGARSYQFSWSV